MAFWVAGRRKAVHEDQGVSRANRPLFRGRCQVDHRFAVEITAEEFARIASQEPRRLCGHDFPTRDR